MGGLIAALLGGGLFSAVPAILAVAALIDCALKRLHRRWLWAARGLTATTLLPKPRVEGALSPSSGRILIVAVALALVALAAGALFWRQNRTPPTPGSSERAHSPADLRELDRSGRGAAPSRP